MKLKYFTLLYFTFLAVGSLVGLAAPLKAQVQVLTFIDYNLGTSSMNEALVSLSPGFQNTTVATPTAFATEIATGNYDLGILVAQSNPASSYFGAVTALQAFVAGGGRAIYADWSGDNFLAAPFGATYTVNTNQNQVLAPDLGFPGPINLSNPGWFTFSTGLNPEPGSTTLATFGNGEAAIVAGNDGRSIVLGMLNDTFGGSEAGRDLLAATIQYTFDFTPIPEPGTVAAGTLFAILLGLAVWRRRRMTGVPN